MDKLSRNALKISALMAHDLIKVLINKSVRMYVFYRGSGDADPVIFGCKIL